MLLLFLNANAAKEATIKKIEFIVEREFARDLSAKEAEIHLIDEVKHLLYDHFFCLIVSFFHSFYWILLELILFIESVIDSQQVKFDRFCHIFPNHFNGLRRLKINGFVVGYFKDIQGSSI